eukprot:708904-Rhodomonas_salina.1
MSRCDCTSAYYLAGYFPSAHGKVKRAMFAVQVERGLLSADIEEMAGPNSSVDEMKACLEDIAVVSDLSEDHGGAHHGVKRTAHRQISAELAFALLALAEEQTSRTKLDETAHVQASLALFRDAMALSSADAD